MNSIKILTIIAIVVLVIGCKKEKVDNSFKSKLVNKSWKSTKLITKGTSQDKWCWKNSIYNFYADGNVYITEGDNNGACFGNVIGRIRKYKYNITADEKIFVIQFNPDFPDEIDSFTVQNISDNKLNVKRIVNKSTPMPDVWEDEFTATP
ncbi:MAG TPA: hypothetical protein PK431_13185 [Chitinophagales bacterium]|nr:hypothetical protein [Chitinophagales bacterium]